MKNIISSEIILELRMEWAYSTPNKQKGPKIVTWPMRKQSSERTISDYGRNYNSRKVIKTRRNSKGKQEQKCLRHQ
jgi:hypothetical protein